MSPHESSFSKEPDYLVMCLEDPEVVPDELERLGRRRSSLRTRSSVGWVVVAGLLVAFFWIEPEFALIPLAALLYNLGTLGAELRRLEQTRQLLLFLRDRSRAEALAPA